MRTWFPTNTGTFLCRTAVVTYGLDRKQILINRFILSMILPWITSALNFFRSVLLDLLQRYNLSKAVEIVLAGSSAGGIGVLNHADWVLNHVIKSHGLKAKLKSIIDSGWLINFQDSLQASVRPKFMSFVNMISSACKDVSRGYPCCSSASCMIARGYYPAGVPLLIVSSMYDIFLFGDVLKRQEKEGKTVKDNSADYFSLVSMYGGAMNESITLTTGNQALNVSVFVAACF